MAPSFYLQVAFAGDLRTVIINHKNAFLMNLWHFRPPAHPSDLTAQLKVVSREQGVDEWGECRRARLVNKECGSAAVGVWWCWQGFNVGEGGPARSKQGRMCRSKLNNEIWVMMDDLWPPLPVRVSRSCTHTDVITHLFCLIAWSLGPHGGLPVEEAVPRGWRCWFSEKISSV